MGDLGGPPCFAGGCGGQGEPQGFKEGSVGDCQGLKTQELVES